MVEAHFDMKFWFIVIWDIKLFSLKTWEYKYNRVTALLGYSTQDAILYAAIVAVVLVHVVLVLWVSFFLEIFVQINILFKKFCI